MEVCVSQTGFDPAERPLWRSASMLTVWRLSGSLTWADEWDAPQAVINFSPPCYERIDLCSTQSALERAVAARSRKCAQTLRSQRKKNNQTNVFKPETKGYEGIQLLLCYFKTSLNHTRVFLLTAAISSGLYDHFNNDNFIYEARLKTLTALKWPLFF